MGSLSSYEMERLENIRRNEEYMESLGLGSGTSSIMAVRPKRRQASQRGKKRKEVDPSELRRSSRLRGGEELVSLPANFKEPTIDMKMAIPSAPRVDVSVEADQGLLDCFAVPLAKAEERSAAVVTPVSSTYEDSVRSLRLAERDVAKVTAGGKGFSVAFHPTPHKLLVATGDSHGRLGIWDVEDEDDERCAREFVGHHSRSIAALAWSGDDLLSCGYDGLARKLSFEKEMSVVVADYDEIDKVGDLVHAAFDGDKVYGAHGDGSLSLLDSRAAKDKVAWSFVAHDAKVAHVALGGKSHEIATAGNDGAVKIWDLRTRKKRWEARHDRSVRGCAWSADGSTLCSVSYDQTLKIFDSKALKSTKAASTSCVKIFHDNRTGRYLTPFKPIFDPHAPSPVVILGSMESPRRIDLISANTNSPNVKIGDSHTNKLKSCLVHQLHDNGDVFRAITSIHDVHPVHHVIAGINNSSRVSIWRKRVRRSS